MTHLNDTMSTSLLTTHKKNAHLTNAVCKIKLEK